MSEVTLLLIFLLSFVGTCVFIIVLRPISKKINLIDIPHERKQHTGDVPLVGGIAMFCALLSTYIIFKPEFTNYHIFMLTAGILTGIGLVDDFFAISAKIKLILQIFSMLIMIFLGHVVLKDLGYLFDIGPVSLHFISIPFTLFAALSLLNATNMLDGMDGLAGLLSLISYTFILILVLPTENSPTVHMLIALIAISVAFLVFNFPFNSKNNAYVFMGDTGSLFLGFTLVWFSITLSQGEHPITQPVIMLWFVAIPLFDLATVFIQRTKNKLSPLKPRRDHIHHIIQKHFGYSSRTCVLVIISTAILLGCIGLIGHYMKIQDSIMLIAFLGLYLFYFLLMQKISKPDIAIHSTQQVTK